MASVILTPAISDAATITGAATSGDLTLSNLQDMQPGKTTRFASLTGMYAEYDLGSAQEISYLWQRALNATSAATVQVRAASSQAALTSGPGYDSTALPFWTATAADNWDYHDNHLSLLGSPQTFRWWRFDWVDAGNPDGFLDLSRVYLSDAFEPERGMNVQSLGPTQPVVRVVSQGSQVYPSVRPVKNQLAVRIIYPSRAEAMGGLYEIGRTRGTARDMVVICDTEDLAYIQHFTSYGLAEEPMLLTNETVMYWDLVLKVTEL